MKRLAAIAPVLLLVSAVFAADTPASKVDITDYLFTPQGLTVPVGTKVTWVNHDEAPHTVVDVNNAFRSAALDTDDSFSFTFTTPGTFNYFCSLHPKMIGKVVVTDGK